jgi:hypothetical protein
MLIEHLPGTQLVMLYIVFGNEVARQEIHRRIEAQKLFEADQKQRRAATR